MSTIEQSLVHVLHLNPTIVDFRSQYPAGDQAKITQLLLEDQKPRRNQVPTIDLIVTLWQPNQPEKFGYHGFSVKPASKLKDPKTIRRLLRDKTFCESQGWGWSLVTNKDIDRIAALAGKQIIHWAKDTNATRDEAEQLGTYLRHARRQRALKQTLTRCVEVMQIDIDRVLGIFATAVLFGFLRIDSTKPLTLREPLCLVSGP